MHEIISIDEHDLLNAVFNAEMRTKLMNIRSSYRFYLLNDRCLLVKTKVNISLTNSSTGVKSKSIDIF